MSHSPLHSSAATDPTHQSDPLTVEQAAAYLHLSTSSIRSYIREGSLKAFRVAGLRKVLIPRLELLALLRPTHPTVEAEQSEEWKGRCRKKTKYPRVSPVAVERSTLSFAVWRAKVKLFTVRRK